MTEPKGYDPVVVREQRERLAASRKAAAKGIEAADAIGWLDYLPAHIRLRPEQFLEVTTTITWPSEGSGTEMHGYIRKVLNSKLHAIIQEAAGLARADLDEAYRLAVPAPKDQANG